MSSQDKEKKKVYLPDSQEVTLCVEVLGIDLPGFLLL